MKKKILIFICLSAFFITGCENQINYYEKDNGQISNDRIRNSNDQVDEYDDAINNYGDPTITYDDGNDYLEEEPFFILVDSGIHPDLNVFYETYIGKGADNYGKEYIELKSTTDDLELWQYQTPSEHIIDTFGTSTVDAYLSFYSPFYGYDFSHYENTRNYYHMYIKENNVIKLFNLQTGEILWSTNRLDIMPTSIIETEDHLYILNDEYPYVYVINIHNGDLITKIKIKTPGFYFIKEIVHNKLIIQTHYDAPIIEEIDLSDYSNVYTEYVRASNSYFDL